MDTPQIFYTPETAGHALEMGIDEVRKWMKSGHLKYACATVGRKQRIYADDLMSFAKWYREEHLTCPSLQTPKARTGNTNSSGVVIDFADRSTAKKAFPSFPSPGPRKRPSGRKRSLDLQASDQPTDRG